MRASTLGHRGSRRRLRPRLAAVLVPALVLVAPSTASAEFAAASGPSDEGAPGVYTEINRDELIFDRGHKAELAYRVRDDEAVDVTVKLINAKNGQAVDRWRDTVRDGDVRTVDWRGITGGDLKGENRYAFRVTARNQSGAVTQSADSDDTRRDSFKFFHNRFPIRGGHDYGSTGSRFGAPRSGHTHQGQDVFASCGTRLSAARGGRVQYSGYQSSAGNYVVLDGKHSNKDYVYMHLQRNSTRTGERVRTGESIGTVGETGNASGCHLHFEIWTKPGWYEGGHAIDPLPDLRHWDRYS